MGKLAFEKGRSQKRGYLLEREREREDKKPWYRSLSPPSLLLSPPTEDDASHEKAQFGRCRHLAVERRRE